MKKINNDESDSSSDEDDDFDTSEDPMKTMFETASLITDKYKEDSSAPTVANRLADMIVQFETCSDEIFDDNEAQIIDPDDEFYAEDLEDFQKDFIEDYEDIDLEDLSNQDVEHFELYKSSRREIKGFNEGSFEQCCKCSLNRVCGILTQNYNKLDKLKPESEKLLNLVKEKVNEIVELLNTARELLSVKDQCSHPVNEVENLLRTFIYDKKRKI